MSITKRQRDILFAIVTEFIDSATPVGSTLISDKYNIKASPATIRYEMVRLADEGYISKQHNSSGRQPTNMGYRYYINDLMIENELNYLTEIQLKRNLVLVKFHRDKLIRGLISLLAELTKYAVVVVTEDGLFYSGLYNLLDYPEFQDRNKFKGILIAFDDLSHITNIFNKSYTDNRVKVIIGDEFENEFLNDCAIAFTEISLYRGEKAMLAIVGPKRMNYPHVLPLIRQTTEIVDRLILGWD